MGKHLKLFNLNNEYTSFLEGDEFITPNVSYVVENDIVYYNPYVESDSSYKMVSLGLPSGLKWADRNIGADSPEDSGLIFQWGDTVGYAVEQVGVDKIFTMENYKYYDINTGKITKYNKYNSVLEPSDDAATVNMGSNWRMPTNAEFEELINNTTATLIDINGNEVDSTTYENLKGVKFTGSNGNSIFIPAQGAALKDKHNSVYTACYLWSSELYTSDSNNETSNVFKALYNKNISLSYFNRHLGISVRGVCN